MVFYSSSPNDGTLYGTWGPSSTNLSSKSFSYNSSWAFVIKFQNITTSSINNRLIRAIDPSTSTWTTTDGLDQQQGDNSLPYIYICYSGTNNLIFLNWNKAQITQDLVSPIATGVFLELSYDNTAKVIKYEFTSLAGTLLYSTTYS